MEWQLIIALVIVMPVILFPVAFVWYINFGGLYTAIKEARSSKLAREKASKIKEAAKLTQIQRTN